MPQTNFKQQPIIESFLDNYPEIDESVYIASSAVIIGSVKIKKNVSIWHNTTIRGDLNYISIDEGSNIQDNCVVHIDSKFYPTIIGKYVTVGHSAIIHACELKDHSFIGMGAIILDGAIIETDAMVAAGTIVPPRKKIPSGEIWSGNPARFMKKIDEKTRVSLRKTAHNYIQFAKAAKLGKSGEPYNFSIKTDTKNNLEKRIKSY